MEIDQLVNENLADCRARFDAGDYRYAITALRWCSMHNRALPDWLATEALAAMLFNFEKGGNNGKRGRGAVKHIYRTKWHLIHRERHREALSQLDPRRGDRGGDIAAYKRASDALLGSLAFADWRQVQESHEKFVPPTVGKTGKKGRNSAKKKAG